MLFSCLLHSYLLKKKKAENVIILNRCTSFAASLEVSSRKKAKETVVNIRIATELCLKAFLQEIGLFILID